MNWLERWAIRILQRSPRISLLAIKTPSIDTIGWSVVEDDALAVEAIMRLMEDDAMVEPASMKLERLYHSPAYGEDD